MKTEELLEELKKRKNSLLFAKLVGYEELSKKQKIAVDNQLQGRLDAFNEFIGFIEENLK